MCLYFFTVADNFIFLIILSIFVIIGIIGFLKAYASRKKYKCPFCGESFRAENMKPENCKICGANLEETNEEYVTDKTK